jgi:hypothetical protein
MTRVVNTTENPVIATRTASIHMVRPPYVVIAIKKPLPEDLASVAARPSVVSPFRDMESL